MRIFMNCFWGETIFDDDEIKPLKVKTMIPIISFVVISFVLGLGAEFMAPFVMHAAETLVNPSIYIDAVLTD